MLPRQAAGVQLTAGCDPRSQAHLIIPRPFGARGYAKNLGLLAPRRERGATEAPRKLSMAPCSAPHGGIRSPTRPLFRPTAGVSQDRTVQLCNIRQRDCSPGRALLGHAVPVPDRGSVAAPPAAPRKLRSARSGPSSSSGDCRPSTFQTACLGLFSEIRVRSRGKEIRGGLAAARSRHSGANAPSQRQMQKGRRVHGWGRYRNRRPRSLWIGTGFIRPANWGVERATEAVGLLHGPAELSEQSAANVIRPSSTAGDWKPGTSSMIGRGSADRV